MKYRDVPLYEATEFSVKRTDYCFVVIVYNESERLIRQLAEMKPNAALADIIIADKRSTDGSTAPDLLKENGVRALLTTDHSGGAAAIRVALDYAFLQGYKGVVLIDGNGKDGVEALPAYLRKLDEGYDFIQGSRFMPGGIHKNTPMLRRIGISCIMVPLLWISTGHRYSDATNGFRGYSMKFLRDPRVEPLRSCFVHFNLQYYLSYRAPRLGFRVVEIPVSRVYPDDGSVPTKVTGFRRNFQAFWEMLVTVTGGYNP